MQMVNGGFPRRRLYGFKLVDSDPATSMEYLRQNARSKILDDFSTN